jgi:uncharacterized protein (DUF433 family)
MTETKTVYEHIVLDTNGIPKIEGTRIKVAHLAAAQIHHGWSAEELAYQYPPLTLGQVYSALAYYWDHQEAIDHYLRRTRGEAQKMQRELQIDARLAEIKSRYTFE